MKQSRKLRAALQLLTSRGLGLMALLVLLLGFCGFVIENLRDGLAVSDLPGAGRLAIHSLLQTLKLYSLDLSSRPLSENWVLLIARLVGALVAVVAVWRTIASVFGREFAAWRASFRRGHVAVLGHGQRNARFLATLADTGARAAAVLLDHDRAVIAGASAGGGTIALEGDLNHPDAIRPAGVERASLVLIGSGSDERNLALAQAVLARRAAAGAGHGRIVLTIDDPALAGLLAAHPALARPGRGDVVSVFNPDAVAARLLLERTVFSDLALAAGAARVHLVFAGFSPAALEVLLQFLRLSPVAGLACPVVTVIAPDPAAARAVMLARCPNLAHALQAPEAGQAQGVPLAWAAAIRIIGGDLAALPSDPALFAQVCDAGPITALVFGSGDALADARHALFLRAASGRLPALAVPFFVRMQRSSSLDRLFARMPGALPAGQAGLSGLAVAARAGEAIEPFGLIEDLCRVEVLFGAREALARRLHEAYRNKRRREGGDLATASLAPWDALDETFRIASRRSADGLPAKRLSLGLADWQVGRPGPLLPETAISDPAMLEMLARLEHEAWRIDRELNGWVPGATRDDGQKIHPHLVDYDALSDAVKDYDREMMRVVAGA